MSIIITPDLLVKLAGEPAYLRGKSVYQNEQIQNWKVTGNKIHAVVEGTEIYHVTLELSSRMLDGQCSCPASDNFDFCKHCVAVALAYANQLAEMEEIKDGSSHERIRAYLKTQAKEVLVEQFLALIEQDRLLEKQWAIKADLSLGLMDAKAIRKQITKALPYRNLWKYRQVSAYFFSAEAIFELILEPLKAQSVDDRIKLVQYAYDRLNKALGQIDDSGGYRFSIENLLHETLIKDFEETNWSNKQKVTFLSKQLTLSRDVYPNIPGDFIDVEDTDLINLFIEQCDQRWSKLLDKNEPDNHHNLKYHQLTYILLSHARSNNNFDREIEILELMAGDSFDYLQLCEKYLDHEDYGNAQKWMKMAQGVDRHGIKERSLPLQIRIDVARGDIGTALTKQWELFSCMSNTTNYDQLLVLYQKNSLPEQECYQKAESHLQALAVNKPAYRQSVKSQLIDFYLHNQQLDKAVEYARDNMIEAYQLTELGSTVAESDPQTAIDFYSRATIDIADGGNKGAYQDAVDTLEQLESFLKEFHNLKWQKVFYEMVNQLRQIKTLKRKPNFITCLDRQFPHAESSNEASA